MKHDKFGVNVDAVGRMAAKTVGGRRMEQYEQYRVTVFTRDDVEHHAVQGIIAAREIARRESEKHCAAHVYDMQELVGHDAHLVAVYVDGGEV